jgi:hypothetical protein
MQISLFVAVSFAIIFLMIFVCVWNSVSHRWKLQPFRPLIWGLAITVFSATAWVYCDADIEQLKLGSSNAALPKLTLEFINFYKNGLIYTQKIIEFFVIPFVTVLVGLAFTYRQELQHKAYLLSYESISKSLASAKVESEKSDCEFDLLLELPVNQAYGKLVEANKRARAAWRIMMFHQNELLALQK